MYWNLREAALRLGLGSHRIWLSISSSAQQLQALIPEPIAITEIEYPAADWHSLSFANGIFRGVFSDQVLEHVARPWQAIAETRRVLRPGGVHICTTCAFNPLHYGPKDYWRFTVDGLRELHEAHGFRILHSGAWGSRAAIVYLANGGSRELTESTEALAWHSESDWPIHVWVIAEAV